MGWGGLCLFRLDVSGLHHEGEYCLHAFHACLRVVQRVIGGWGLWETGQHGALGQVELFRSFPKINLLGVGYAIGTVTEINGIKI